MAAELSRRGYNVAVTMGNAKKVDLLAEHNGKAVAVQVKAIAKRANVGWPINPDHKYDKDLIFALVVLGPPGALPDYYLLTGQSIMEKRKVYKKRAIVDIWRIEEFKDNWVLLDRRLK